MNDEISRDDKLRSKRGKGIVAFHKFVLKHKPKQNKPYCFVEGEDSKYLLPRILMICKTEPEFIRCNGKSGVIEAYKEIVKRKKYSEEVLLFFVDKDFDASIGNKDIYETPSYSIENLYTSPLVFSRILKSEFNLDESDEDYTNAYNHFINIQNDFHNTIALLNAWIYSYKSYINRTSEPIKLRLNELSFKEDIIEVSIDGVKCKYTVNSIEEKLSIPKKVSIEEIKIRFQEFINDSNRGRLFRGKFELEFFKLFLEKLIEDRNKKRNRKVFKDKGKVRLFIDSNILTTLSSYSETPICLYKYIEDKWTKRVITNEKHSVRY